MHECGVQRILSPVHIDVVKLRTNNILCVQDADRRLYQIASQIVQTEEKQN